MTQNPLFRDAALKRLASPENLDECLLVVPSQAWLALVVLGALLVGVGLWSLFAHIPVSVVGSGGFVSEQTATIFLPVSQARMIRPAMPARVNPTPSGASPEAARFFRSSVTRIATEPATRAELIAVLGDTASLPIEPRIAVTLSVPGAGEARGVDCAGRIIVGERRPISFLFGGNR